MSCLRCSWPFSLRCRGGRLDSIMSLEGEGFRQAMRLGCAARIVEGMEAAGRRPHVQSGLTLRSPLLPAKRLPLPPLCSGLALGALWPLPSPAVSDGDRSFPLWTLPAHLQHANLLDHLLAAPPGSAACCVPAPAGLLRLSPDRPRGRLSPDHGHEPGRTPGAARPALSRASPTAGPPG